MEFVIYIFEMREKLISYIQANVDNCLAMNGIWREYNFLIFFFWVAKKNIMNYIFLIVFVRVHKLFQELLLLCFLWERKTRKMCSWGLLKLQLGFEIWLHHDLTFKFYGDLNASPCISLQNMYLLLILFVFGVFITVALVKF